MPDNVVYERGSFKCITRHRDTGKNGNVPNGTNNHDTVDGRHVTNPLALLYRRVRAESTIDRRFKKIPLRQQHAARKSMTTAGAAAASAARRAERRAEAVAIDRLRGRRCTVTTRARREGRHLAAQFVAVAMRAFGVVEMTGTYESLEGYSAVPASIFVDRHFFRAPYSSSISIGCGCAYSTSTPRVALGCRKQIIPASPLRGF
jgi:hypothetical protein